MTEFKGFILNRHWRDAPAGTELEFWLATEAGPRKVVSELVHELSAPLQRSQVPVVIDHMGRVDATRGLEDADFQALLRLMDNPRFYVKVSGIDRIDAKAHSAQRYRHGVVLARALVERFPERCVWGTDWPHPNHTHIPDDGALVDALAYIAPDAGRLEQLLVRNPQNLYRFPPVSSPISSVKI